MGAGMSNGMEKGVGGEGGGWYSFWWWPRIVAVKLGGGKSMHAKSRHRTH
jgi:hypothetical protein